MYKWHMAHLEEAILKLWWKGKASPVLITITHLSTPCPQKETLMHEDGFGIRIELAIPTTKVWMTHPPHVISICTNIANNVHYTELAQNWALNEALLACMLSNLLAKFTSIGRTRKCRLPNYSNPPKKIGWNLWDWPIASPHMICHVIHLQFPWESCKHLSHASMKPTFKLWRVAHSSGGKCTICKVP